MTANHQKTTKHPELKALLIETQDTFLIEACPEDCDCTCGAGIGPNNLLELRSGWKENLLGKTSMLLRAQYQEEPSS